jgi:hypothetical protein
MAIIRNARDLLMQAAPSRYSNPPNAGILLTASAAAFHVDSVGATTPATITFTAQLLELTGPTVTFSASGATLSVAGNVATLAYANMPGGLATVTATLIENGVTYTKQCAVTKVLDGAAGLPGTSVSVGTIYKQAASIPTTPTGGTFNFTSSVLTAPAGWSTTQPTSTTTPTWAAEYSFATATPGSTVTAGTWSTPVVDAVNGANGSNGADGASVLTLEVYYQVGSAPSAPTSGSGSYTFSTDTFSNTGMTSWSRTLPASSTTPTYRSAYTFATTTPAVAVTGGTWSAPIVVAQNGVAGGTGGTGSRGAGHFYATGSSWVDATADAATPGANVTDDVVTISNGSTFVSEKKWSGSAWVSQTVVLDGSLLVPGSVAAAAVTTASLAALSANLGTATVATGGSLSSGQTAYNTGTGWWIGMVGGVAKFSFGVAGGSSMTWDGTTATFSGTLSAPTGTFGAVTIAAGGSISSGQTAFNTGNGFHLSFSSGVAKFSFGDSAGAYMYFDGTVLRISGVTYDAFSLSVPDLYNLAGAGVRHFSVTATPTGGKAPLKYQWNFIAEVGESGISIENGANSATCNFGCINKTSGTSASGTAICTVVDADGRVASDDGFIEQAY